MIVLLLLEQVFSFHSRADSRVRRYGINFFVIGSNALVVHLLLSGLLISAYKYFELHQIGLMHMAGIDGWWNVAASVLVLDGVTYFWHRAYHTFPLMWRMHRVHHSDLDLDVTSSGRFHITEMILSAFFRLAIIALIGADLAAVVIFEIIFGIMNQFEHANIHLPKTVEDGLRKVLVTPDMHRIHHSQVRNHTNSNYGTIFSFWDRLFHSYTFTSNQRELVIGLPEYPRREDVGLVHVLIMPFTKT